MPTIRDWKSRALGDIVVTLHPETRLRIAATGARQLALIGTAFDPEEDVYDEGAILGSLLNAAADEDSFYSILDRLAGRFALVVHTKGRTEIFQDAMGSRSVFYSTRGEFVAASHAELVADYIGSRFADFFIPYITSKNFIQRDVKYLPGLATPYNDVLQLTPNTKLVLEEQRVERFWPREEIGPELTEAEATSSLVVHLRGLARYVEKHGIRPVVGLTAGTDSRGVFAATKDHDPLIFTYVRSEKGDKTASSDARAATALAGVYGLDAQIWAVPNKMTLNASDNDFSHAYRRATSYYRGSGSPWLENLVEVGKDAEEAVFIRGFGGEVMRGFYQNFSKKIRKVSVFQLADAYDVNAGSAVTRAFFSQMMEKTSFNEESLHGYDPNDIFYWEHRMGTWGSIAMAEADVALPSMVAYNSRNLFQTFMRLPESVRASRNAFDLATLELAPALKDVAI
jgi:hypothetical protein